MTATGRNSSPPQPTWRTTSANPIPAPTAVPIRVPFVRGVRLASGDPIDVRSRDRRLSRAGFKQEFGWGELFKLPFDPVPVLQLHGDRRP